MAKPSMSHVTASGEGSPDSSRHPELHYRERIVWRSALLLLSLLAVALAVVSWGTVRGISYTLQALPVALVMLVALFVIYAWTKSERFAELRGEAFPGLESPKPAPYEQAGGLFSMVIKSQQGYRDLIDTFEDLVFSLTLDGKVATLNRSFADLMKVSFAGAIGHRVDEFFEFPDFNDAIAAQQLVARFLERRRWTGVVRAQLKQTGVTYYFDCVFQAIMRDGSVQGISGWARDVSRAREKETQFTELFQTLREGVYLASADDRIAEINPALVQMLGYGSREEVLEVELATLYENPAHRAQERANLNEMGFLGAREIKLKNRQGHAVVALHTTAVIRDPAGKFLRYQGTFVDVTEQREMERRLHREQEFARRLMDGFPDVIVTLDSEGRYTFASHQIFDVLGYRPKELIGQRLGGGIDPHDRRGVLRLFQGLIRETVGNGQIEYRAKHKDGTWRLFRASARPLRDERGHTAGIIVSARDITEGQRLQQQLIQSERLAAMGQMIAGVAHELNNPLTAILGVIELMRDHPADDMARRQLELAHRQARRAAHIVEGLLVFSRPTAPKNMLLHLSDLVQRTVQLHEHSLRANRVQVDLAGRTDLPTILGDPNQLTQVFLNLIVNAEQAIRERRDQGNLRIRLGVMNDRVLVTFQDDGVGIKREALPRIFDPFFTTKRPGRGTGLGLSICMAIIREHNGDISAQPVPDGGSVFTVSLPVCTRTAAVADMEPGSFQNAVHNTLIAAPAASGKRVLVVDDEEGICELVTDCLGAKGHFVDAANTISEALALIQASHYDAILCDVHLESRFEGSGSGFTLYDQMRESMEAGSATLPPFIFMTGDRMDRAMLESFSKSGQQYLQKPFRINELVSILDAATTAGTHQPKNNSVA